MTEQVFIHHFTTGRRAVLTVSTTKGGRRDIRGQLPPNLTPVEEAEYKQWRNGVAEQLLSGMSEKEQEELAVKVLEQLLKKEGLA